MEYQLPPISVPLQAVWLQGLRKSKDDRQPEGLWYLQFRDPLDLIHETRISAEDVQLLLDWMKEKRMYFEFRVR